jgi:hypothetical protein
LPGTAEITLVQSGSALAARLSRVLFPCSLRQLISIPISVAALAPAYDDKALPHHMHATFGPFDIAFEKMIKIGMTQQRFELLCNVAANVIVRVPDFIDELLAPINDEKNILHVTASEEIVVTAAAVRLQLCRHEQFRREAPNGQCLIQ